MLPSLLSMSTNSQGTPMVCSTLALKVSKTLFLYTDVMTDIMEEKAGPGK